MTKISCPGRFAVVKSLFSGLAEVVATGETGRVKPYVATLSTATATFTVLVLQTVSNLCLNYVITPDT